MPIPPDIDVCKMHDDDSATGIMVQNFNGDQWIEYGKRDYSPILKRGVYWLFPGDKQFFEPQACVNRARR
jgi:hypothetical protein